MKKWVLGAVFVLGVGFFGVVCSGVQFPMQVSAIAVEGNEEIRDAKILNVVKFKVGDEIGESEIKNSSQAIYDLGWFSEVAPQIGEDGSVTFRVVENAVIRSFEFTGNVNEKTYQLFGITLFKAKIMGDSRAKNILRDNGVKKGEVLHLPSLQTALQKIIEKYNDLGYVLVMIGDVTPGPTLKIEIIEGRLAGNVVQGLRTVPENVILDKIDLTVGEPLRQKDLQRVMSSLQESVYVDQVDLQPLEGPERDTFSLQWTIVERSAVTEPVQFDRIELQGVTQFPLQVAQRALGAIPADGPIDNYGVLRILEPLHTLYYDAGFIMARFTLAGLDGGVVTFRVDEGRISEITIAEGTLTKERVVRRNLALHVGRVLTLNDLKVTYQSLNSLGYFESVSIDPVWKGDGVHVTIQVTDKSTLGGLNGSIAVDPSTGELVGTVSVNQRNLFGTGQDVSVGYDRSLTSEGDPEETTWHLGYSTVAYFSGFDRVEASVYRTVTDVEDDDDVTTTYLTIGGSVAFKYPVADYADLELSFAHERVRALEETEWTPVEIMGIGLAEDSTDDSYLPSRGTRRSVSLQKAGGFSIGEELTKLDVTWATFAPMYSEWLADVEMTWAMRFKLGLGTEDLSATYAYDFGGSTSVRGFTDESVDVDRILITNFEYRLQPVDGFAAAAFFDWGVDLDRIQADQMLASSGFELSILVIGVLVRLDVVWVFGEGADWVPRFDFAFGSMF